ncbi:hypothetical protein FGIG_11292 [Fasciola gigantica]|uniref:Uncharacterized protein n=1 Tax=Fasciola gigantica TaxID=46835 RepID=A0A504Z395_FASGI|nr:hypothetical protein FGIG_11292 [Fasciola gigantica]
MNLTCCDCQKSPFFSPVNPVSDCGQLIASLENHFERPSKDRSDILSAPMSLHRGRHITEPPGTSPSCTDILHALRSNQYEANENLLDELVCKPANPYSNLMRTKKHDEIKLVLHTEPKKLRIPEQTTHAHLASQSVHIPRKPMNTPVVLQSKPRLTQSTRLFAEPFQVASSPYYTGPPSSFMRNTHNSLIRTAKYGGFRPGASPAFASPVPVVTVSRVLSPRAEDENQTESARHLVSFLLYQFVLVVCFILLGLSVTCFSGIEECFEINVVSVISLSPIDLAV